MALRAFAVCAVALVAGMALSSGAAAADSTVAAVEPIQLETPDSLARAAIEKALDQKISVQFTEEPLEKVMTQLVKQLEINVDFDSKAIEAVGVSRDTPITRKFSGTARSALRRMLSAMDLTMIIRDETLIVTSVDAANDRQETRVYPAADLGELEDLSETIQKIINPTTWDEVGGTGSISIVRGAGALVVSQSAEVHTEIAALIAALRRSRDLQGIKPPVASKPVATAGETEASKTADDRKPTKALGGLGLGGSLGSGN